MRHSPEQANRTRDVATIRGHVGLRRLRSDVQLTLSRTIEHDTERIGNFNCVSTLVIS